MYYNGIEFKPYDDCYYVSAYGDIYSTYINGLMKHSIVASGHHRVDIHGKHMFVHRLVYETWVGSIPENMQINHKDDNKDNNHYSNLYAGTQAENIADCFNNGNRIGHINSQSVFVKSSRDFVKFPSTKQLIEYTGHSVANGAISKVISKKWFKDNYMYIGSESVSTIETYKTICNNYEDWLRDRRVIEEFTREGSRVGRISLPPPEAQGQREMCKLVVRDSQGDQ